MYARRVSMDLRPNSTADFTHKLEAEIIPLLRKQGGFQDEITFVAPDGKQAFAVSLWDSKESAEAYNRGSYAEVTKILSKLCRSWLTEHRGLNPTRLPTPPFTRSPLS
jgi:hypothetical protein